MSLFTTLRHVIGGTDTESTSTQLLGDGSDHHARLVAPASVHCSADTTQAGDQWLKTLVVIDWPDTADPGILETITTHPSADVDLSIHASPRPIERGIKEFENAIRDLQTIRLGKEKNGNPTLGITERRIHEHEEILAQLTEGSQSVFDVAAYITVRGETQRAVDRTCQQISTELAKRQLTVKSLDYIQTKGLISGSPVAEDAVSRELPSARTPMLGSALGAAFPFSTTTVIEETGVRYGYHATTNAPVVVDRWRRPNGYNVLAAAKIGSGKSITAKLLSLREIANDPETILIMIDPLEDFRPLANALNADQIVVGGTRQMNPMEIEKTPAHVLEATDDLDPYVQRLSSVMGFFETYFAHVDTSGEGLDKNARAVLGRAVQEAYEWRGITRDPSTHGNTSPTVQDVFDILGQMVEDASSFLESEDKELVPTQTEIEKWEDRAAELRIGMQPFIGGGEFANLAGQSDIDLRDAKVTYLDLQQGEGECEIALMMQLLFDAVYERVKQTTKNVILVIDEAQYLMKNAGTLDWLERAYRHSRHYDLSIHLVTQEASDFFVHEKAAVLAKESSIKILQRLPGLSDAHRQKLGLNEREADFLRQAKPGTRERGYSHALVCVEDEGHFPVKVTGLPEEMTIVDAEK
ncbi:VirB4 family type IV secretion system protein [Haladaptatus sp. NG-WS-4]